MKWEMAIAEVLVVFRDIIVALSAIIVAIVAIYGVRKWKQNEIEKRKLNVGINLLEKMHFFKTSILSLMFLYNRDDPDNEEKMLAEDKAMYLAVIPSYSEIMFKDYAMVVSEIRTISSHIAILYGEQTKRLIEDFLNYNIAFLAESRYKILFEGNKNNRLANFFEIIYFNDSPDENYQRAKSSLDKLIIIFLGKQKHAD